MLSPDGYLPILLCELLERLQLAAAFRPFLLDLLGFAFRSGHFSSSFGRVGLAKEAHCQNGENGSAFLRPSSNGRRSDNDAGNRSQLCRSDANGIGQDRLRTVGLEAAK